MAEKTGWKTTGLSLLAAGVMVGSTIVYASNPIGIRLSIANKLFHSLPAEKQTAVVGELFLEQEYQNQVNMVLFYIENNVLAQEDYAYIGGSSLLKLDPYTRAATLELILEESPYEVQKYITINGIDNLTPEDSIAVVAKSSGKIFTYLSQKFGDVYDFLFRDY